MKAIKIKLPVTLTTGVDVPANSVAIIGEMYLNVKAVENGKIPCQVPILLYKNEAAHTAKKRPILEIESFNPLIEAKISVSDYETKDAETLGIKEIKQYLTGIFGAANIEQITF